MRAPDPDFWHIRPLGGDMRRGFEEFVAQLARRDEAVPDGSVFDRLEGAGGMGGVECLWTLPSGAEWGWQCKMHRSLDKAQLSEPGRD